VELTEKAHPARKVIEAHKSKLRTRLAEMCAQIEKVGEKLQEAAKSPGK